jgi:hypothetical protein
MLVLAYNRTSERELLLSVEQAKIAGYLNVAKSYALEKHSGGGVDPDACAFGVHIVSVNGSPARVVLFQDLSTIDGCVGTNFNKLYDGPASGVCPVNPTTGEETTECLQVLDVDPRIAFSFSAGGSPLGGSTLDLVFEPPYLKTYANGTELSDALGSVRIQLKMPPDNIPATVEVGEGAQMTSL